MNKNKYLPNLICLFLVLLILFSGILFSKGNSKYEDFSFDDKSIYDWSDEWEVSYGNTKLEGQSLPLDISVERGKSILLKKTLPQTIKKYNCVLVEGNRQDIIVSVGGILREEYSDKKSRVYGKTSPSAYLIVPIYSTDAGMDITVRISSDSMYSGHINDIILGNEISVILMLLKSNVPWIILTTIVLTIGIVSIVSFIAYRQTFEQSASLFYLFTYALLAVISYVSTLTARQFIAHNLGWYDTMGYCCYMLSIIPIILYYTSIKKSKSNIELYIFVPIVLINYIVQISLFIAGYYDFHEMKVVTHVISTIVTLVLLSSYKNDCEENKTSFSPFILTGYVALATWNIASVISSTLMIGNTLEELFAIAALAYTVSNFAYIQIGISKEQKNRKDAESASKAKSLFLANMSHEIRTPINAVLGMNELILREAKEDNIRGYSVNIADAGKSLLALVNDILDFSKIESGKMDIIPTEYKMKVLLNDLILMTESRMSGKDLKLVLEIDENIPSVYYGDEVRIKQVATNILTNAVKYTKQGTVTLSVSKESTKGENATLRFSVKDTGKGIKREDLDNVLNSSFNRVNDEENRSIEGTGLGLSITRQLLELMDSKLEVESVFGEGSTFAFSIEQKVIDESPMGSVHEKEKQVKKRKNTFTAKEAKLLVVDDVKMNLMVLKGLLKPYGVQLETCDSGQKCLDICKEKEFDIILLDHMMPEMDGIETFKHLKEDNLIPESTKVIVLTANAVMGASEMYIESGFDAYMTKPVDIVELDNTLKKFLGDLVEPLPEESE